MSNSYQVNDYRVYNYIQSRHILVSDPSGLNKYEYFDANDGVIRIYKKFHPSFFVEVRGDEATLAISKYQEWKRETSTQLITTTKPVEIKSTPQTGGIQLIQVKPSADGIYKPPKNPSSPEPKFPTESPQENAASQTSSPNFSKAEMIKSFCNERGIKKLIHFTRIQNLASILQKGLISHQELSKNSEQPQGIINDSMRLDNCSNANCLSISYPNYKMFYSYSCNDQSIWVVLILKVDILWEMDCAFCRENAAAKGVSEIPIENRKKYKALQAMFEDGEGVKRDDLYIPNEYPTNPQAEILVFQPIPPSYITEVLFFNSEVMDEWKKNQSSPFPQNMRIGIEFYKPRSDYTHWLVKEPNCVPVIPIDCPEFDNWLPFEPPEFDELDQTDLFFL